MRFLPRRKKGYSIKIIGWLFFLCLQWQNWLLKQFLCWKAPTFHFLTKSFAGRLQTFIFRFNPVLESFKLLCSRFNPELESFKSQFFD